MLIKLYHILFEQKEQKKPLTNFAAPEYTLVDISGYGQGLALVYAPGYLRCTRPQHVTPTEYLGMKVNDWLCAMALSFEQHGDNCNGAAEVNNVAGNPKFPAAGGTIYASMSKWLGVPLISDRHTSTSNSAKKAWAKIETSPDWERVVMDGYMTAKPPNPNNDEWKKVYYDVDGSWPNREIIPRDGPKTPHIVVDDCPAPEDADGEWDELNRILGSADGWLYKGPLDVQGMLNRGLDLMKVVEEKIGLKVSRQQKLITNVARDFFGSKYRGISG